MNSFARKQEAYDNAMPVDNSRREDWVERRTDELTRDMWQDLEHLTDALSDAILDIGWYRKDGHRVHPLAVTFLTLLRDGSDDINLAALLRAYTLKRIRRAAEDRAEEEAS